MEEKSKKRSALLLLLLLLLIAIAVAFAASVPIGGSGGGKGGSGGDGNGNGGGGGGGVGGGGQASAYTVAFDSQGGSAVASITDVDEGSRISEPMAPERPGYAFGGWHKDAACVNAWDFAMDTVYGDITLYAKWGYDGSGGDGSGNGGGGGYAATYAVTFDALNESAPWTVRGIESGSTISKPADPSRDGHDFAGWYRDQTFDTQWNFSTDRVYGDMTLYAKWSGRSYTVTFDSTGGTAVAKAEELSYGQLVPKPADPSRERFAFTGWFKEPACSNAWDFGSERVTKDMTLYAGWVALHTVTFDAQGGSPTPSPITNVRSGSTILLPGAPSNGDLYVFQGWFKGPGGSDRWNQSEDRVTSDITLYAHWRIVTRTVTFDPMGGHILWGGGQNTMSVDHGSLLVIPWEDGPWKAGHVFGGWYRDDSCIEPWNFSTPVTADVTLYAKWTPEKRTVTFNGNGGTTPDGAGGTTSMKSVEVDYGSLISAPTFTNYGHYIVGWYVTNVGTQWFFETSVVTSNMILYALWEHMSGGVTFNAGEGSFEDGSQTVTRILTYGEPCDPLPVPTRGGYSFVGWYTQKEGGSIIIVENGVWSYEVNKTLYARWAPIP
ncbi:MAG: InlB B-repeat-containing protein [Candidatus Methanoplasma sp.]|jgi:uncharacterized repeat protein (TIGR02543 family)|nr:InlB B-repeat-containing protein [Candidatus Methanoplasma sp.]